MKKINFESGYWDFYLIVKVNKRDYYVRVKNPASEITNNLYNKEREDIIKLENDFILYPYITINNDLSLTYRKKEKSEGLLLYIKEKIAFFIYNTFKKHFDEKQIYLVYEKFSQTAQDNSYYFFKHVYENYHNKNVFYIIDKKHPDYKNVKRMKDRVIPYMSIKHLIYLIASKLFVASESKGHAYIIKKQNGKMRDIVNRKKFVFLQHGVLGFKKVDSIYRKNGNNAADLFVTSSNTEKEIVKRNFNYNAEDVIITGLARWDVLKDKSKIQGQKEIIFMPTWRNWLDDVSEEMFLDSDYYKYYSSLLNSNKFKKILQDNNILLHFFMHPKFKAYINNFETNNERIRIYEFGEIKINELLMRSSLLITDYSSIAWDFYYMKKPVIFFQFDYEAYTSLQGSYLNMETDLFGDRILNKETLIDTIQEYVDLDFKEKQQFSAIRDEYFKYVDHHNSERIFQEIINNKENLNVE